MSVMEFTNLNVDVEITTILDSLGDICGTQGGWFLLRYP